MTIGDKIRNEKLQYNVNREATKISALSSSKIDQYEYLTGEEILPSDQSRIIEQTNFTYSLVKAFAKQIMTIKNTAENQRKTIENTAEKQTKTLETLNTDQQLK